MPLPRRLMPLLVRHPSLLRLCMRIIGWLRRHGVWLPEAVPATLFS